MTQKEWEWPMKSDNHATHSERAALLRPIPYEMTSPVDEEVERGRRKALSLNISRGGMLLMMDQAPKIEQVLKVYVPTPITIAETPTLAEVRWVRKVPFGKTNGGGPYFVGLKFIF
ncbi:MAG: PilZ domain-containing protein [Nitrospira sp.]|nr:PilZ domain-containing protein [Nitrospira sp.]